MASISIFDIFKIGIGPSSSHTLGPWNAAQAFTNSVDFSRTQSVLVELFGSLSKTGIGHGTDIAILLGLSGFDVKTIDTYQIDRYITNIKDGKQIKFANQKWVKFDYEQHLIFQDDMLPFHPNGMRFTAFYADNEFYQESWYSIGGGFICQEEEKISVTNFVKFPFPIETPRDIYHYKSIHNHRFIDIVKTNELSLRTTAELKKDLIEIWECMLESIYKGCHTFGILPGGLNVERRAAPINRQLLPGASYQNREEWISKIKKGNYRFTEVLKWISCFALAVNEENASFSRIVTAPTNGAAGVIPAVYMYHHCFYDDSYEDLEAFFLAAGEIGSLFKKGATISAAMGGCQAEIGVSSAMAAAGLTAVNDGTCEQILMAAEIAMEHHLGLTCDPINGLVQIPCIERNTMGAIKAVTASQIALSSNPEQAKVSLDKIIKTMWETAKDMNAKYKETAEGGLAKVVLDMMAEC